MSPNSYGEWPGPGTRPNYRPMNNNNPYPPPGYFYPEPRFRMEHHHFPGHQPSYHQCPPPDDLMRPPHWRPCPPIARPARFHPPPQMVAYPPPRGFSVTTTGAATAVPAAYSGKDNTTAAAAGRHAPYCRTSRSACCNDAIRCEEHVHAAAEQNNRKDWQWHD